MNDKPERGKLSWMGFPVDEMTREQLVEIVYQLSGITQNMQTAALSSHEFYKKIMRKREASAS